MGIEHDTRGVSEVVGSILIFGILILTLTTYQAVIVPQQNAQTEFQHFEDVRNEMIELRNAISTAGQADVSQFPSVTLGTNYQMRTLTINPPDPAGTLRTSEPYNITISNGTEEYDKNISTRFIEYQPGYNEISIGSTWYENSVLYADEPERKNAVTIEDQHLVTDGNKLKITALQNSFQRSGTSRVTVELIPNQSATNLDDVANDEELTVRIPTRLNKSEYWHVVNETLENDDDVRYNRVDEGSDINYLVLNATNRSKIELHTVDIYP